ncbi:MULTISPECIES: hypothetical protein [Comamonas]|uniref:hypothetical protein n=1 Tax=Comamonas TaxID=283 RepID=UPI000622313A|nr:MULTISPECIES: hypothetical protein [Comamonas]KKI13354.1 hypothetical protein XA67_15085 [Comamonas thiooxydans]TYK75505.1 hypothetical protein FSY45_13805 [Comamonas sp. Z1]BCX50457.1 hypothetical protein CTYAZ2_00390 [Comamonas testosteroni]
MKHQDRPEDTDFDLRARAEMALAFEPGEPPPHLLRHTPWYARRGLHALCAAVMVASVAAGSVLSLRPPQMVRSAIEHEYYERTLRGQFIPEAEIARHMDWPADQKLPGYTQLMRPCDIDGSRAYHLTTFFEKGGIVTVLAFEQPQRIADGQGWWANSYWQVVRSREGRPLVLISQKKQALAVASRALGAPEKADG